MGNCKKQCEFCEQHYKKPITESPVKTRLAKNDHRKFLTLRIPNELFSKLVVLASADNRTINNTIRTILKNEIDDLDYDFNHAINNPINDT